MKPYVDILGTRYTIEIHDADEDECLKENSLDGYCSYLRKLIVLADFKKLYPKWTDDEREVYQKHILRHELIHGFFNESGLQECSCRINGSWADNEEMVDWIAIQFPKMLEAFRWCECIP